MTTFKKYWLFTLLGTLAVSVYPLYMGFRVLYDMSTKGIVSAENFPKYIIPYTPIALALLAAVALMPLAFRLGKRFAVLIASVFSVGLFFLIEWLFEKQVLVESSSLLNWQMFSCYVPPDPFLSRPWSAVNVLMGEYSPTFKLHFYLISVILIVAVLNCLYGFGQMLRTRCCLRRRALIVQSVCTALFLGLCIFACFTAFFRTGELTVSPLSAGLMILFFAALGVTAGSYVGSFLLGRKKVFSVLIPSVTASLITLVMYIGEMFLLSGHLYRFGTGLLFDGLPGISLAPVDILTILLSGGLSAVICILLNRNPAATEASVTAEH